MTLSRVQNLEMTRNSFTLSVPEWTVRPGEVVGLIGPNGAGKTTLLELMHGVWRPDRGSLDVLGLDPFASPVELRSQVGFASEQVTLFPLTVAETMTFLSTYYPGRWDASHCEALMRRLGVRPEWRLGSLSKGQELAVRLVAAMAFRPRLLLLDEPTAGLDLGQRTRLFEILLELVGDDQCSVVISSHSLPDVERICDRLLVLIDGQVHGQGTTDELVGDERTLEEAMVAWGVAG